MSHFFFCNLRNETLKPFHKVFNILKEYELFNEVSLDSTWRFVSYILQDEEISQVPYIHQVSLKETRINVFHYRTLLVNH